MTQLVGIARILVAVIKLGFREQAVQKSEYNAFIGYNLRNAVLKDNPPLYELQGANVLVSQGTVTPTQILDNTVDGGAATVIVDWDGATLAPGQSATDKPLFAIWNQTQNKWFGTIGIANRSAGTETFDVPVGFAANGDEGLLYLGFVNNQTRKSSDSVNVAWTAI
jgi:hypothetical protein